MVKLTASAACLGCPWTAQGKPADVDKAAQRHTRAGHATGTVIKPAREVS